MVAGREGRPGTDNKRGGQTPASLNAGSKGIRGRIYPSLCTRQKVSVEAELEAKESITSLKKKRKEEKKREQKKNNKKNKKTRKQKRTKPRKKSQTSKTTKIQLHTQTK